MIIKINYRFEIWYIIICIVANGIKDMTKELLRNRNVKNKSNITFLTDIIKNLSITSMIICYLIEKKYYLENINENQNTVKTRLIVKINLGKDYLLKSHKKKMIWLILCICLFYSIEAFLYDISRKVKNTDFIHFVIFSFTLIYNDLLFFSKEYYNHYVLIFYISFINLLSMLIYIFIIQKSKILDLLFFFILFILYHISAFNLFLFEYLNRIYFLSLFLLSSLEGISKLISIFIFRYLKNNKITFIINFNYLDWFIILIHFLSGILFYYIKCIIIIKYKAIYHGVAICIFEYLFPFFPFKFRLFESISCNIWIYIFYWMFNLL